MKSVAPREAVPGGDEVVRASVRVAPPQQACVSLPEGNPEHAI